MSSFDNHFIQLNGNGILFKTTGHIINDYCRVFYFFLLFFTLALFIINIYPLLFLLIFLCVLFTLAVTFQCRILNMI